MISLHTAQSQNDYMSELAVTEDGDPFTNIGHIIFINSGTKNLDDYVEKCLKLSNDLIEMAIDLQTYIERNLTDKQNEIGIKIIKGYHDLLENVKKYEYNSNNSDLINDKLNVEIKKILQTINYYVKHPEYFMPDENSGTSDFFAEWLTRKDRLDIMRKNTFKKNWSENTTKNLGNKKTHQLEDKKKSSNMIEYCTNPIAIKNDNSLTKINDENDIDSNPKNKNSLTKLNDENDIDSDPNNKKTNYKLIFCIAIPIVLFSWGKKNNFSNSIFSI